MIHTSSASHENPFGYTTLFVVFSRFAKAFLQGSQIYHGAVSIWEAAIKIGLGRLEASVDELIEGIEASGFIELPITARQSAIVTNLPFHHRDPFDRVLVAQALHEPLRLLTVDMSLRPYSDLVELV